MYDRNCKLNSQFNNEVFSASFFGFFFFIQPVVGRVTLRL